MVCVAAGTQIVAGTRSSLIDGKHPLSHPVTLFGATYLILDSIAILYTLPCCLLLRSCAFRHSAQLKHGSLGRGARANALILTHHTLVACVGMPLFLIVDKGHFFIGHFLLFEASAVFLNVRWLLSHYNMKHSMLYIANGISLLASHAYFRILVFPRMFAALAAARGVPLLVLPAMLPLPCMVGSTLLLAPQLYWGALMVRGFVRHCFPRVQVQGAAKRE